MNRIAILLTCFNRKEKTIACLSSLNKTYLESGERLSVEVYLTDDGCTDGTADSIREQDFAFPVHILQGNGLLYWNGGMIKSWSAAVEEGDYDGYLWLNDDTVVLPEFWGDLIEADIYSRKTYGRGGIYVGSTKDAETGRFTYGGFNFVSKWTLKDSFVHPDGEHFQECQCAHGNITFVTQDVVDKMGILYDGYIHGVGDHDYTYRAHKAGFPILVMPHYSGECENDHVGKSTKGRSLVGMSFKERIAYSKSPLCYNLHNTLLFQKRCFPYRYPFVWIAGYLYICFPSLYQNIRRFLRK